MLRNYIRIGIRTLTKHKGYTLINVFGLTVGFASVILILLYVNDEVGYDRYDDQTKNIYRIYWQSGNPQTRTPHPMAQALTQDFPEVEHAVSLSPIWGAGLTRQTFSVRNLEKDIRFDERDVLAVDSTFFDVFPLQLTKGNRNMVLRSPGKLLLSESTARKYFGDDDPIGKHLAVNDDRNLLEVEGVFQDVPRQSHFHFNALAGYVHMKAYSSPESEYYTWNDFGHFNYILLRPDADPKKLEGRLLQWAAKYIDVTEEELSAVIRNNEGFRLQNIRDIHLNSHLLWELEPNGNKEYVYIMSAAALLILIIAGINFMNLTTSKSADRAREIGVRRTMGAMKQHLSVQFIGESVAIALFSTILAGLVVEVALPFFNQLSGKNIDSNVLHNPATLITIIGIGLMTGILSGLYPSFYLSSLNPVSILKGKFVTSKSGNRFSKTLVIFQFTMAIILISGTVIIYDQMNYMQNKNLGFTQESLITVPVRSQQIRRDFESLKTELKRIPGIVEVGAASNIPGKQFNQNPVFRTDDNQRRIDVSQEFVDHDFIKTLNIEFAGGRDFSRDFPADSLGYIINETAARELGFSDAVGQEIVLDADGDFLKGTIVGVVKDFHFQSLHQPIRPILFILQPNYTEAVMRIASVDSDKTLLQVKQIWAKYDANFDFEYAFLDETIKAQYEAESKMGVVFSLFATIAIIVSCLGLLGLASLNYLQRRKEVGIRKVLGAPIFSLLLNLIKNYSRLILLSTLLAAPFAWWLMENWLSNFMYKVELNPLVFVVTGLVTMIIAWLTIGYLTLKTASANPVDTLKEE
jgi:putative ABC transport system permease protein